MTRAWTDAENAILQKFSPSEGQKVAERLPGRTAQACSLMEKKLGTTATGRTDAEHAILLMSCPPVSLNIADRLPDHSSISKI